MELVSEGVNLIPVTFRDITASRFTMYHLLDPENTKNMSNPDLWDTLTIIVRMIMLQRPISYFEQA